MSETLKEQLIISIQSKKALAHKIAGQMAEDVKNNVLSPATVRQNELARDNFDAALIQMGEGDYEKAIHFFSRGCANLGEFKGRSDKERNQT